MKFSQIMAIFINMVNKVRSYMEKHHMVERGDTLIVGVSGGADSVCLLSVLMELRDLMGFRLVCAHVNHMFRETATRDEEYVRNLCRKHRIACKTLRADVQAAANEYKMSFEEAGRLVRYGFFHKIQKEYKSCKIAVAHNIEDCGETLLFHLFRGSNLKGLGGIQPVAGDVIRPLMNVSRKEIEAYLKERNIPWMEDETNASVDYARNRIRHKIIPEAEAVCCGAGIRMAETAEDLRLAEDYLAVQTAAAYADCCSLQDGGIFINEQKYEKLHAVLQSRVLYSMLEKQAGAAKDLGRIHVKELENLFTLQSGRKICLPYRLCAYRTAEGILLRKEDYATGEGECTSLVALLDRKDLEAGKEITFELDGLGHVKAKLLFNYEMKNIPQKTYTKWFDYDKISKCPTFRKRMEGDYLVINEAGNRKKLKEYFIENKIPAYNRDNMWILTEDSHVIWIPGYRMSSFYKISETTRSVLELTVGGENE